MKNGYKKYYIIFWIVLLIGFNVIAFVSPGWIDLNKYTPAFWIGYAFITLSFIGQLICAMVAFSADSTDKLFLNMPILRVSYTCLILSFIVGGATMLMSNLPYWIAILVNFILMMICVISVVKARASVEIISDIEDGVKEKTVFIGSMISESKALMETTYVKPLHDLANKVYESFRYADPMSNENLKEIEGEIKNKMDAFRDAVKNDNSNSEIIGQELLSLIEERNDKCKRMK